MPIPDADRLSSALEAYPSIIAEQGSERLPSLDEWYRERLPGLIQGRDPAHITAPELERITEWKMARGVWRGRNLALVRRNPPEEVEAVSAAAFARAPHPTGPISELSKLQGVGPATASAIAAAAHPHLYPFFDEDVAAQIPGLGEVAWTLGYYARYAAALRDFATGLGDTWTPVLVERALWARIGGKARSSAGDRT